MDSRGVPISRGAIARQDPPTRNNRLPVSSPICEQISNRVFDKGTVFLIGHLTQF
jgi:hypothetical protein